MENQAYPTHTIDPLVRRPQGAAWLLDDQGATREEFEVGEMIMIAAHGLRPATVYNISLQSDDERDTPLARLMTDRYGSLPATTLLPFFGLIDPELSMEGRFRTHEQAERALGGHRFVLHLRAEGDRFAPTAVFRVAERAQRRQIFPSDRTGRLRTGFLHGKSDVFAALRNFPPGHVRIFLVPSQFDWQPGDPIVPVRDAEGAPLIISARVEEGRPLVVRLWPRELVQPGSYQMIARSYRLGWYNADAMVLLPEDIVSGHRSSALVVRRPPHLENFGGGSTLLTPELTGRPLASPPYFQFVNNFPKGTDIWAALDPAALPPGLVSQRAAIYAILHKTQADWAASSALTDISGPGQTPAVEVVPIVPGCINWNETLVWPNPQVPGKYDLVIDFGNNVTNPAQFTTDASFDPALDMIDGYIRVGFYVTEDPSLPGPFAGAIGRHEYNAGTVQVPTTDTGPLPTQSLQLKAVVRYPAQVSGQDAAFLPGAFPLVVIMHGNSSMETSYQGYNYLLDHLASHGFIAMSIYAPVASMIEARARAILKHLEIMKQKNDDPGLFHGHVDMNAIGIMGHSRGGEAVVRAGKINAAEALGWHLAAGIAIAPTDFKHYGAPGVPLLVIYGANDGDVAGWWGTPPAASFTGFDIYDEAGRPRSFVFVYGATHDRFNSEWSSIETTTELEFEPGSDISKWGAIHTSDLPKLISPTAHQDVVKGYATAYYQLYLQGKSEQVEYFTGALKPTLVSSVQIHTSHQESLGRMVDNYEQLPHNVGSNTLGGVVTSSALATPPAENSLHALDSHSPHQTSGGDIAWNSAAGIYLSNIPLVNRDLSDFTMLSFRVTQRYGSAQNPANQAQDFAVRLTDGQGKTRAVRTAAFTDIPYPYERGVTSLIKSALKTVRIPLLAYTVANPGADNVDLADIQSVSFEFSARATGEIEIDDIEFGS